MHRAAGLADRGPADQQHEPAPLSSGCHLGPDPELGGIDIPRHVLRQDLIGHPRHADRSMYPCRPLDSPHRKTVAVISTAQCPTPSGAFQDTGLNSEDQPIVP